MIFKKAIDKQYGYQNDLIKFTEEAVVDFKRVRKPRLKDGINYAIRSSKIISRNSLIPFRACTKISSSAIGNSSF